MDSQKEELAKFQRAFLVLVDESKFNIKNQTISHKMTCHTVLMGPADSIEALKASGIPNKGPWETKE